MPRLSRSVPQYRKHKASGQAFVELSGKRIYLGPFGTKVSKAEYDRLTGEWLQNGRKLSIEVPEIAETTIAKLLVAFLKWAQNYYRKNGEPTFLKRIKWEGPEALAPGKHALEFDFKYDGLGIGTLAFNNMSGLGRPGTGTLKVDGKEVQTITMEKTLPMILQWDESFDIGSDTLTGVNDEDYKPPFTFTGKLNKLTIKVDLPQLTPEDIKRLEESMKQAADAK
jgi:hypothetical protein